MDLLCPNCGRNLPEDAQICPSCKAVQHLNRRRRAEAFRGDAPPRVSRRIQPEKTEDISEQELYRRQGEIPEPEQYLPAGLRRQKEISQQGVRYVRHSPERVRKKVDGKPVLKNPPIYRKSHKRLKMVLIFLLMVLFFTLSSGAYLLFRTESGQQLMAEWGWSVARTDAYITLGKQLMDQAYFTRSLEALKVAIEREPRNVDALLYMAQDYLALGMEDEAVEIYESLISDIAPQHPSAYRQLINIYQSHGYYAESLALMEQAADSTLGTQEFQVMIRNYTPKAPVFSHLEGRYNEDIDVTISIPEGETVYYTTDETDPSESGLIYSEGTKIHVSEGKLTLKAIGFTEQGIPSEQVTARYTVIIPTPAAPKSNYASGVYKNAPKVSLRPGDEDAKKNKEIVAIYYTLDGRQATTESTLYTGPIQLPVGDSTLRAISVDKKGKVSYEMKVTYKVQGNLKRMFSDENDSFKNLSLYKTTYQTFVKAWGKPESYEALPREKWYGDEIESYEARYSWGSARFAVKTAGKEPVLYYLDTSNTKMTAPRSTRVGMSAQDVMDKFRDLGHVALDDDGNRLLYNWNSANVQFGTYRKDADGGYAIHYYDPIDEKQTIFAELTYYLSADMGEVSHILWRRYQITNP